MIGKKTLNAFVLDKSLQGFDHLDLGIPFLINFFFFIFFKKPVVLIYFGCAGSLLLHWLSLVVVSKGYSLLWCVGFSPWWLLLLQSMGSRASGLQ